MRKYPKSLKEKARKLARAGMSKVMVSEITGIHYATVLKCTGGMRTKDRSAERISGNSLRLLRTLVSKGYTFRDRANSMDGRYKTLRKYFPVKKVKSHGVTMFVMEGSERAAMEAMLDRLNLRSLSWQTLSGIRATFGIKNIKGKYKTSTRHKG